jgi:predicted acylesterase/phospholipase RssA
MIIYSFIGALKNLKENGNLKDLEEISCSSSGSIVGFFYILTRGDVDEMLRISLDVPLGELAKPEVKSLLDKYGLIDSNKFERYMSRLSVKLTDGKDPTFKELYEWNPIKLHVPTYDLVTNKTVYMSVDTTPNLKVSKAVRRSISIPVIMTPDEYRYIDGSVGEYSPHVPFLGRTDVFEIRFRWFSKPKKRAKNLFSYLYDVVFAFLSNRVEYTEFPRLDIYTDDKFEMFNFSMSTEQKLELYRNGYYQACERSQAHNHNDHDSSSSDSKSPSCSHACTRDPSNQSEGQHPHQVCDSDESLLDMQSSEPRETCQSSEGTSSEISHSD